MSASIPFLETEPGSHGTSRLSPASSSQQTMSVPELGWRCFQFFDKSFITDPKEPAKKFYGFKELSIKKWRASVNKPFTIVGDERGVVFKINSTLEVDFWKAYNRELVDLDLADNAKQSFVVSIGDDDVTSSSILKLWDLDQWDKQSPTCRISVKTSQGRKSTTQTAVAVAISPKQNCIAVGFADSAVSYCFGDLTNERTYKWKSLRDSSNNRNDGGLLGLSIADCGNGKSVVFVICENSVQSFILNNDTVIKTVTHDARGALPNCWRFNAVTNQLIIANNEMVYFYDVSSGIDESARCHALARGTTKLQLLCGSFYVTLITEMKKTIQNTSSMLNVYDVDCRYVASTYPMGKTQMFTLNSDFYAINEDGSLTKYSEKPMAARLDIVMKKNLFDIAIALAKRDKSTAISSIYLKYAEYLYKRGDFSNSVQQYVQTIGTLEPSYVVTRFLEGTRASHLSVYLEALQKRKLANEHHTLLLLGSYLTTSDDSKVQKFVENAHECPSLDVDESVKLLRAAGKYRLAAQLATQYNRILLSFAILVEDLKDFDEAAERLNLVTGKHLFEILDTYGLSLLEHKEKEVVEHVAKAVQSDDADMTVLVKMLNNYPQYLRTLYDNAHEKVKSNVLFRNVILENALERFKLDKTIELDGFRNFVVSLVNQDNFEFALRLGRLHNYSPLVIYVLQQTNSKRALADYLIREGGIDLILDVCDDKMIREMWIELVNFVAKSKDIDESYVIILLRKLTATKYVHPLMVTKILSQNTELTISSVEEYLKSWLAEQTDEIRQNTKKIEEKIKKTAEIEKQIHIYDDDVQTFQALRCAVCDTQLQVPAVHFTCKHSFHAHCYESYRDQRDQCAICTNSDNVGFDSNATTTQNVDHAFTSLSDLKTQIETCGNTMAVIADFIARGAFDNYKLGNETVRKVETNLQNLSTNPFDDVPSAQVTKTKPVSTNPFDEV